jgi:predicted PurR-regulated permease PerM
MSNHVIDQNRIRQLFFLAIIILLAALLFFQLKNFLPALLGAITLYIIMRHGMLYLTKKKNWKTGWAAWLLMFLSMIVILLPFGLLINMLSSKISYAINNSDQLMNAMRKLGQDLESRYHIEVINDETINKLGAIIADTLPKIVSATFSTIATILFMYVFLYFMLVNGMRMEKTLYEHVPLKDENVNRLGAEIKNMVISNAIGIPVIALLQGIVGLIGYLIIGIEDPWFWFVVTCIAAMIPIIGAALAYVPLAIIFFANNHNWQGVIMLVYGFGIIGTVDNVFRLLLQKKIGNVHPLITIFGVILGLDLFGFIGLIFGPLLISLFILLVKIYSSEFFVKQRQSHHHV